MVYGFWNSELNSKVVKGRGEDDVAPSNCTLSAAGASKSIKSRDGGGMTGLRTLGEDCQLTDVGEHAQE